VALPAILAATFPSLLKLAGNAIDRVIPDKAKAAEAKRELAVMHMNGELKRDEIAMSAILMEAQSQDPWTSRARPMFMYVIYIYMLAAIPYSVIFVFWPTEAQIAVTGMQQFLEAIPSELYALFGAGYLGYGHFRGKDKSENASNMRALLEKL